MSIHIGELVEDAVYAKRLTYREFGALINRNEKTIPDIFRRGSVSIDLLVSICGALKIDFLSLYYSEEPLKSLRTDDSAHLRVQIQDCTEELHKLIEENKQLNKELSFARELIEALRESIFFAKSQIKNIEK